MQSHPGFRPLRTTIGGQERSPSPVADALAALAPSTQASDQQSDVD